MGVKVVNLIIVLACLYRGSSAQCDVNIRKQLPGKDPVLLSTTGELLHPSGPSMSWGPSEESVLVCSGDRNSFTSGSNTELTIKCHSKDTFTVGEDNFKFNELECSAGVTGDVQKTDKKCADSGTLYEIGFKTKSFGLVKYIDVCYNTKTASVIYTYHTIRGASVKDSVSDNDRPGFKVSGIPSHVKPANSYKQTKQLTRFTSLLGNEALAKTYLNKTSFLARGHLAPDNDGVFKSWQAATYFYINVAPQWQIVNSGNWLRIENLARKVASQLGDDVEVYTGNHGILTLPDVNNNPVELSLEPENNIAVPKFFWKILKHKNQGIVFITLNNPFATEKESLCKDVCEKYGFNNPAFEDFTRGYTYCCTVADFAKAVKYLPKEAKVKTVLKAL